MVVVSALYWTDPGPYLRERPYPAVYADSDPREYMIFERDFLEPYYLLIGVAQTGKEPRDWLVRANLERGAGLTLHWRLQETGDEFFEIVRQLVPGKEHHYGLPCLQ